jgi:TRAP-type transport system periplasmic protein
MPTFGTAEAEARRLSTHVDETDFRHQGFARFAERVAVQNKERVTIESFPSATLQSWSDRVDALKGGVSGISRTPADTRLPCCRLTWLYPAAIDVTDKIELDAA